MSVVDDLARARDAYERREWVAAYDAPGRHERRALAATTSPGSRPAPTCSVARTTASRPCSAPTGSTSTPATPHAVRCAFWLAGSSSAGEAAVAGAGSAGASGSSTTSGATWSSAATADHEMFMHTSAASRPGAARPRSRTTVAVQRPGPDGHGLNAQGRMLIYTGQVPQGLALLDEAMVGVDRRGVADRRRRRLLRADRGLPGGLRLRPRGRVDRGADRWIDDQPGLVAFTGQCAVHRGQIMRVHGAFSAAIEEFDRATGGTTPPGPRAGGPGHRRVRRRTADPRRPRRRRGGYEQAAHYGFEPQPGLALLWLAAAATAAASGAVRRLLAEPRDPVHRSRVLPGAIEILLAAGRSTEAGGRRGAGVIADRFGCPALRAMAGYAPGPTLLAAGDPGAAVADLRRASTLWSGWRRPTRPPGPACWSAGRCGPSATRSRRSASWPRRRRTFRELGAAPAERSGRAPRRPPTPPV